ncbi:hypothetical protein [Paludibacterium denitrificans]|uniref:hypothetical protein n=1 Tax=Paludibacterium denitrificans TaxID=2675226 RepID=UPI001E3574E9|nr:hypothetical protein [Paludibacterium denitrificans]
MQLAKGETGSAARTLSSLRRDYRYNAVGEWMATIVDSQLQKKTGNAQRAQQLLNEAESQFQTLAETLSPAAQMEFARACYQQGRRDSGDAVMRDLVRNHHDDEDMLGTLGDLFEEVGQGESGRQLIADNVQSVVELNNEAVRLAQAGQFDEAIERFVKAHEDMPHNVQVMLNLVNATMAYVHSQGWHESHMRRAYDMLCRVRELAPTNNKFQKLARARRLLVEKLGKPQWVL